MTCKVRITHVLLGAHFGGAEKVALTLHRLAREFGDESKVIVLNQPHLSEVLASELGEAIQDKVPNCTDVLHIHLPSPSFLGKAFSCGRSWPAVVTFHLLPPDSWPLDRYTRIPSKWLLFWIARLSKRWRFVCLNNKSRPLLQRNIPSEKLEVISNAPPLPSSYSTFDISPTSWPCEGFRLLFVGRLVHQKGVDQLITALASEQLKNKKWSLLIVGDGEDRDKLESLVCQFSLEHRIRFLGAKPASQAFLHADLLIIPSRYEGCMPLVALEAIERACPVLASDILPNRQRLSEVPEALLPEQTVEWSEKIASILDRDMLCHLKTRLQTLTHLIDRNAYYQKYRKVYIEAIGGSAD